MSIDVSVGINARRRVGPRYVPSTVKSVAVAMTPKGGGTTLHAAINLSPSNNANCLIATAKSYACIVTFKLSEGKYVATFATYDGKIDSLGNPTGNELSANEGVPLSISSGGSNSIHVTLGGLPVSVADRRRFRRRRGRKPHHRPRRSETGAEFFGHQASRRHDTAVVDTEHVSAEPAARSRRRREGDADGEGYAAGEQWRQRAQRTSRGEVRPHDLRRDHGVCAAGDKIARITTNGTIKEYALVGGSEPFDLVTGPDGALWFTEPYIGRIGRLQ